ncbi:MAG: tyrosine-type recombinase/integrase, partial [Candidatus Brocadiales bacterium]|nr:tyrosine-type recombinase/integrase [Candidatus Brocadiales bacterium]
GLRVSEAANVRCGDPKISYGDNRLFVRNGKGYLSAHIEITESLKKHLKNYLQWKSQSGESTGENDHLFVGQRGPWTAQALQQIVKKYLNRDSTQN